MRNLVDQMSVDWSDSLSRDFISNEDVIAGYIQNTFEWDKGVVVAGVRYEHTSMDLSAFDPRY